MTSKQIVLAVFPRAYLQAAGGGHWMVLVKKGKSLRTIPTQLGVGQLPGEDAAWDRALENIRTYGDPTDPKVKAMLGLHQ